MGPFPKEMVIDVGQTLKKRETDWTTLEDGGDGTWIYVRRLVEDPQCWQALRIDDRGECMSNWERKREGIPRYSGRLVEVDLSLENLVADALECYGVDGVDEITDLQKVAACVAYGAFAPLETRAGDARVRMEKELRRRAQTMVAGEGRQSALQTVVNLLGQTAAEYRGQKTAVEALPRLCEAGDEKALVVARMYRVVVDFAQPPDFLPFIVGYQDAVSGAPNKAKAKRGPKVSPEYGQGYLARKMQEAGCATVQWLDGPPLPQKKKVDGE